MGWSGIWVHVFVAGTRSDRSLTSILALSLGCAPAVSGFATTTEAMSTNEGLTSTATTATTASGGETTESEMEEPICCGCLCVDPTWSCSAETCLFADGSAAVLGPEAGFIAITPSAPSPESRIWYAFRPADESPEDKPLAVFFNGGPGSSSAILFGFNTNAVTLDPDVAGDAGDAGVVDNPHRWTRFANVLYVDPREAGFSYDVPRSDGAESQTVNFVPEHDASYYVRFLLRFLARHPQIRDAPVILVGESYGGHRAALMLQQLLFYDELSTDPRFRDPELRAELLAHYAVVFPDLAPDELTPEVIAGQFGHQVLIQPALTWINGHGSFTPEEEQAELHGCIPEPELLQCDEPPGWWSVRGEAVTAKLVEPETLSLAIGADASSIAWMYADARADAYPRGFPVRANDETAFRATFGELARSEHYYHSFYTRGGLPSPAYNWMGEHYGTVYLRMLPYVETFITNAGKDLVVYSPDIPLALASYPDAITSAFHDDEPVDDEPRPGRISVTFTSGGETRDIRFPHYAAAGHAISSRAPAEFLDDVEAWFLNK